MIQLAINILWLLLGIIALCLVVYLVLYVVKMFIAIPDLVEKSVWIIILILILIAALGLLAGGHSGLPGFRTGYLWGIPSGTLAAHTAAPALNMSWLLNG